MIVDEQTLRRGRRRLRDLLPAARAKMRAGYVWPPRMDAPPGEVGPMRALP